MQTNFFPVSFQQGVRAMDDVELLNTNGGGFGSLLMDVGMFLISPGHGLFWMGLKAGYNAAAEAAEN